MAEKDPPAPEVEPPATETSRRISFVWLVPLLALVVALAVAWRTYADRGPLITITFENAAGVEAGQTTLRFRDVNIGIVEKTEISPDLQTVVVTARINKDVARYLDGDAEFWVVRPSVSAQGVSGIETVISGVYIGSYWNAEIGQRQDHFKGLERPPLTPTDQPGLRVRLRAPGGGSMSVGAPVLFKDIKVGKVEEITLTDAGDVMIDVFVDAPNHLRLTDGTRFWNSSGFSINLNASGATLNVASLISLLQGGVSFDTVGSDMTPVEDGHVYELYASETAARENVLEDAPGARVLVDVDFDGSVKGLQPGAAVEFRGIKVGEVRSLQAAILREDGQPRVTLRATLSLVPGRLGIAGESDDALAAQTLDLLESQVSQENLRAQIAASGLLSQTLYVNLIDIPDARPASFQRDAEPNPRLPSAPSDVSGIASSAQGVLDRFASLPLEDLVQSAETLLANINSIVTDPKVRAAPENLGQLIADLRETLGSSGIKDAPAQISAVLASVRSIVDEATKEQLVAQLGDVLATTKASIASVGTAADGVPPLLDEVEALSAKVRDLPLDQLLASSTQLVDNVDAFVRSEGVTNVPKSVEASLADLRGLIDDLRNGGAVDNVNATLASVRQVSDQLAAAQITESLKAVLDEARLAAANIGTASNAAPKLIDSLTALSDKANALPLDQLVASAEQVLATADTFLSDQGVGALPPKLAATLDDLQGVIDDLRNGGAVDNVNATLASVRQVSDQLAAAQITESLKAVLDQARLAAANIGTASSAAPKLIDSLTALSDKANALPLDQLVASAEQVLATADTFLSDQGVGALPPKLAATLDDLQGVIDGLQQGGAVDNVNATLVNVRKLSDELAAARLSESINRVVSQASDAASNIDAATQDLPKLIETIQGVATKAESLPLDDLVTTGTNVLATADAVLASPGVKDVPPKLAEALDQLRAILAELREGGAVQNVNDTLASADRAASAISAAADDLPALLDQLSSVASRADAALASVSPGSDINRDTLRLLQEVRDAARSVNSLVSALERRPNSVLFGR